VSEITTKKSELHEDEEMVRRAQDSPEGFRPLYEKYFKPIFLFVLRRVNDKSLSSDITSQVFLKALLKINDFKFKGVPFSAWLYRIALNECFDFFRKTKRHRYVSIDDENVRVLHEELTSDSGVQELFETLPAILEKLEMDELQLLELRYFEQRPFKEVADILGVTENYAKVKTYRLLDKMKGLFLKI
jgi:RNA polymerase sigma-70 factor, ECF subfamily